MKRQERSQCTKEGEQASIGVSKNNQPETWASADWGRMETVSSATKETKLGRTGRANHAEQRVGQQAYSI
jgi:hypothetical protein